MTRVSLLQCLSDGTFSIHNSLKRKDTIEDYCEDSWSVSLDEQITPHHFSAESYSNTKHCQISLSVPFLRVAPPSHQPQRKRRRTFCESPSSTISPRSPSLGDVCCVGGIDCSSDFLSTEDSMSDDDNSCSSGGSSTFSSSNFDHARMVSWFQQYANTNNDSLISGQNWERFKSDCGFKTIMDLKFFFFVYSLDCTSKEHITRGEWIRGMYALKCDRMEKLHASLDEAIRHAQGSWCTDELKQLFTFVFRYLRENKASRTIDVTLGARALSCLIDNRFSKSFVHFLLTHQCKRLNLDQFRIFIDFSNTYEKDLHMTSYDPNDAFPCLFDEFVEFFRSTELRMPMTMRQVQQHQYQSRG
uniref:Defective in cullin neddylation protein n=1 Tax=Percolomonas cosmopolitus TaxID=63605 RepID=A0A7S1KQA5_9EUKA|mmetsp:Transcript_4875/g.18293  ORF Transcript_4875/g.18293 Transcript_4875/m.18293 type:complete len:358 (+) Transcript_4875:266-1339(+)